MPLCSKTAQVDRHRKEAGIIGREGRGKGNVARGGRGGGGGGGGVFTCTRVFTTSNGTPTLWLAHAQTPPDAKYLAVASAGAIAAAAAASAVSGPTIARTARARGRCGLRWRKGVVSCGPTGRAAERAACRHEAAAAHGLLGRVIPDVEAMLLPVSRGLATSRVCGAEGTTTGVIGEKAAQPPRRLCLAPGSSPKDDDDDRRARRPRAHPLQQLPIQVPVQEQILTTGAPTSMYIATKDYRTKVHYSESRYP